MRPSLLLAVVLAGLFAGCGGGSGLGGGTPLSLRGLPAAKDPPLDLDDDDDLGRARAQYEAMPLDDPGRAARRHELVAAYQRKMAAYSDDAAEGFRRFQQALGLWDARELQGDSVAGLDQLAGTADDVFKQSSSRGADLEAVTALAALRAMHPGDAEKYEKTWKDILSYTNELAVAEAGPGAERSRAILMLEDVTANFPSKWAGEKLVGLYLDRQANIVKALTSGNKGDVLGANRDPGVMRPIWNLVRIYARMRRLGDAPAVVDKLANQFGDEPELRKRLTEALAATDGKAWIALMAAYVPAPGQEGADPTAAELVCEEGVARLPKAVDPPKCAGEIARVTERVPLALRWIEQARALAPDDHDVIEIAARLYIARIADLALGERLEAARARMSELEAFYAENAPKFKDKPMETTLADAFLVYGRGLTTQGHVAEGVKALERSRALDPGPDVTEELANVAMKTGRYADARAGFAAAAAVERATPIETTFDRNRLLRLEGEAAFLANDKTRAKDAWATALKSWEEMLTPNLNARARSLANTELGRLYHDRGEIEKSLASMNAAVDADPEQAGIYGDVIAFLITRGHYNEALDAYHRALGRSEVTEYLRAYTSIWLTDLAHLRGVEPDPSTKEMLAELAKGHKWYNKVCAFKLGSLTWPQLLAAADTRGKRAEAYFYEAMSLYGAGERNKGAEYLREVVNTQMLGFFEYDMSKYYLRFGVPGGEGKH